MSDEEVNPEILARATLSLLETRLRRLEFLLIGKSTPEPIQETSETLRKSAFAHETVNGRLQKLQSELDDLRKIRGPTGNLVRDVESLRSKVPELFTNSTLASKPTTSDLSTTSSAVLAHASLFPETASRLSSFQSLQIPSAKQSSRLLDLRSRIDMALRTQQQLELRAEELRERSAKCLEWWVEVGVVGMGEIWEEWESRVIDVERDLKRVERRQAIEDGYI